MNLRACILLPYKAFRLFVILFLQQGWLRSYLEQKSIGPRGQPIPWYTYASIEYFSTLDFQSSRIFEYGCGSSSIFWSNRSASVTAVENDPTWAARMRIQAPSNLVIIEAIDRHEYIQSPLRLGKRFDVIVIDGRFRHDCVAVAAEAVESNGMLILDNSDWYPVACKSLREMGWQQIDFSGFGPINAYCTTTSMFIRSATVIRRVHEARPIGGLALTAESDD